MKFSLVVVLLINSVIACAQVKISKLLPKTKAYENFIFDYGNPLEGDNVLIFKSFSYKTGSLIWFLNESKASNPSFLNDNPKDLHAGIYLEDHGGLLKKITFKDFAGALSQPEYLLNFCIVEDQDKNGFPEFYLTYMMHSDGLDAKPLKVIIYTTKNGTEFIKSKITAWIPYQEEDFYREEKDSNYKNLPKSVQKRAEELIKQAQK